jgi:hypothetical protein
VARLSLCALLCSGLRRSEQRPDLTNLCSHGHARLYVFAGPNPMLEIAVAVALGPRPSLLPHHAYGIAPDPLPPPVYRGDRLESALHSAGLWPDSRAAGRCRPDAWGRVSFAATPLSIVGWIYDPDHSLRPGMYVDVPHLHCLLVAAPITVEGLDHVILKPKEFDRVVAVNVDEVLRHLLLALSKQS